LTTLLDAWRLPRYIDFKPVNSSPFLLSHQRLDAL